MKKILCLLLALMMLFSVAALIAGCEDSGSKKNSASKNEDEDEDEDEDNGDNNNDDAEDNGEDEPEQTVDPDSKEAYVGTWTKERTEEEPFTTTIQLFDDGTGKWGKNTTLEWTFDEDAKCISVTMIHSNGQERGDTFTATLQEDGTLYCDYTMTVKLQSGEMMEVEGFALQRSK